MITQRVFDPAHDFDDVSRFLRKCYEPLKGWNWIQPIWDYAYHHPATDPDCWTDMGLWLDGEQYPTYV